MRAPRILLAAVLVGWGVAPSRAQEAPQSPCSGQHGRYMAYLPQYLEIWSRGASYYPDLDLYQSTNEAAARGYAAVHGPFLECIVANGICSAERTALKRAAASYRTARNARNEALYRRRGEQAAEAAYDSARAAHDSAAVALEACFGGAGLRLPRRFAEANWGYEPGSDVLGSAP